MHFSKEPVFIVIDQSIVLSQNIILIEHMSQSLVDYFLFLAFLNDAHYSHVDLNFDVIKPMIRSRVLDREGLPR